MAPSSLHGETNFGSALVNLMYVGGTINLPASLSLLFSIQKEKVKRAKIYFGKNLALALVDIPELLPT